MGLWVGSQAASGSWRETSSTSTHKVSPQDYLVPCQLTLVLVKQEGDGDRGRPPDAGDVDFALKFRDERLPSGRAPGCWHYWQSCSCAPRHTVY